MEFDFNASVFVGVDFFAIGRNDGGGLYSSDGFLGGHLGFEFNGFGLHKKLGVGGVVLVSSVIWIEVLDGGLNTNDEPFDVAVTIGVVA